MLILKDDTEVLLVSKVGNEFHNLSYSTVRGILYEL